jgi:hypothetical protein
MMAIDAIMISHLITVRQNATIAIAASSANYATAEPRATRWNQAVAHRPGAVDAPGRRGRSNGPVRLTGSAIVAIELTTSEWSYA